MSRWCQVISQRFDYMLGPTQMLSGDRNQIMYLPQHIVDFGVSSGQLRRIKKPAGYSVDKAGRVVNVHRPNR